MRTLFRSFRQPHARGRLFLVAYLLLLGASHLWRGWSDVFGPTPSTEQLLQPDTTYPAAAYAPVLPFVEFPTIDTLGKMHKIGEHEPSRRWPRQSRFAYHHWPCAGLQDTSGNTRTRPIDDPSLASPALPILYLHGAPGLGSNAQTLAGHLNTLGYTVYSPDLLGFGQTTNHPPDCSIKANALACLRLMDAKGIAGVHLIGHSQGGGVAIELANMAPERVLSVTLLAAIGGQSTEGSGSHLFEHARYRIGGSALWFVRNTVPHFGLIRTPPRGFLRYFADTDQRPLDAMTAQMRMPVLVLHGRYDFLVPPWAAERQAALLPSASGHIVMTGYSHFIPFIDQQARDAAGWIDRICREGLKRAEPAEAEQPSIDPWPFDTNFAPVPAPFDRLLQSAFGLIHFNVLLTIGMIGLSTSLWPRGTLALLSALMGCLTIDYAVALLGMTLGCVLVGGRGWRDPASNIRQAWIDPLGVLPAVLLADAPRSEIIGRSERVTAAFHAAKQWAWRLLKLAMRLTLLGVMGMAVFMSVAAPFEFPWGWWSIAVGLLCVMAVTWVVDHLLTRTGRRLMIAQLIRWSRYEFWPTWLFYIPLYFHCLRRAIPTGHPLTFTSCNPGISHGGGFIGESKIDLYQKMTASAECDPMRSPAAAVSPTFLIAALQDQQNLSGPDRNGQFQNGIDAATRLKAFESLLAGRAETLQYPLVIKPDSAQRGFGFKVVRSIEDARAYFRGMHDSAVVQPFHPGPHEVGILWTRQSGIFSITLKEPPVIIGNGKETLADLILTHPRYRLQARTFLARHRADLRRAPKAGERVTLAVAGNHCQGSLFRDGTQLATPALNASIDALCRHFGSSSGQGDGQRGGQIADSNLLDFARLDVRCRSLDQLAAGQLDPWSIVELNGTSSESTNIYDPDRSLVWAYGRLFAQWDLLYAIGHRRAKAGHRPMRVLALFALLWRFYRHRTGSSLAD